MDKLDFREALDNLDPGPVPLEEILGRARRVRRRRTKGAAVALAAIAAAVFALLPRSPAPSTGNGPRCVPIGGNIVLLSGQPKATGVYGCVITVLPTEAHVVTHLADGRTLRGTKVDAGGRLYVAFVTTSPVTSVTWYSPEGTKIGFSDPGH